MKLALGMMLLLPLMACGSGNTPVQSVPNDSHDYGDYATFHACEALPRRKLSALEICEFEILKKNCSPAADCLLSCGMSPDGHKTSGGCEHRCFARPLMHDVNAVVLLDFSQCGNPRNNGVRDN